MRDHIPDVTKMVPDGYYGAVITPSQGRPFHMAVRVCDGKVFSPNNLEFMPLVCSEFVPIATWNYCHAWPQFAADELDTLRTANAALVEEVERLQAWKDAAVEVESKWDAQAIARLLGGALGESTRTVIAREVPRLVERVKRLEEAGERMRLLCADGDDCDAWEKAKATS